MSTEPVVTKLVIDGVEIPLTEPALAVDDEAVSRIFKMMEAMDESEQADYILSTSTTYR